MAPQNYNYQQHNSNYPRKENDLDLAASLNERQTDALKKLSTEVKTGSHLPLLRSHTCLPALMQIYGAQPSTAARAALRLVRTIMSRVPLGSARTCSLPTAGKRTHTHKHIAHT